jgi:ParB family chromosome partitioning protein
MSAIAENIDPAEIEPSPSNPRLIFPKEELARLRESIDEVGILVPLTVYKTPDGKIRLIDGERRLQCALELGLPDVPCYVVDGVDETRELEWMFSIHMMKEDWAQGPIAKALLSLAKRLGGWDTDKLRAVTGLTPQQLAFYQALGNSPPEILERVIAGDLPANLVADAILRVANPMRNELPDVADGKSDESFVYSIVNKRDAGRLPDVVAIRKLRTMIQVASEDPEPEDQAELKSVIQKVLDDPEASIEGAYEDTVGTQVASQSFIKAIERFGRSASHAARQVRSDSAEAAVLADQIEALIERLTALVTELRGIQ